MRDIRLQWRETLPIVTRELRFAARRRITYRVRFIVALVAAAQVIVASILLSGLSLEVGHTVFWLTSCLAMVLSAGSGLLLTADSISREIREGTLGLLFLTRLGSIDIILGKFAAGFLNGASVGFSAAPFLAFSLCLGGVTAREFWLMSFLLLFLLVFSLSLGIFFSTILRSESAISFAFFSTMFLPALSIPLLMMKWTTIPLVFARWNPLYPFLALFDTNGNRFPEEHAIPALIFQFVLVIGMLSLSAFILPRTIRLGTLRHKTASVRFAAKIRRASRPLLDSNPVLWLSARQNHPLLLLYICIGFRFLVGLITTVPFEADVAYVILLALLPKIFVLWSSSGMMVHERQSGFLESLLTTPIAPREILQGKIRAVRRQIYPALLFACLALWHIATQWWAGSREIPLRTTVVLALIITLLVDVHAGAWIGLWQGLEARDRRRALIRSLLLGLIFPWVPSVACFSVIYFIFQARWMHDYLNTIPPMMISANIVSFALACLAMARLHDRLRSTSSQVWSFKIAP